MYLILTFCVYSVLALVHHSPYLTTISTLVKRNSDFVVCTYDAFFTVPLLINVVGFSNLLLLLIILILYIPHFSLSRNAVYCSSVTC